MQQALDAISKGGSLMACIVDEDGSLDAILTDSDVRRSLLKGAKLTDPALAWSNRHPVTAPADADVLLLRDLTQAKKVREIPLLDHSGRPVDIFTLVGSEQRVVTTDDGAPPTAEPTLPNAMLLLAGGLGTRLRAAVDDRPKPLALVGDRPILETIMMRAAAAGIRKFYVAVNYMADKIEEHLAGPSYHGLSIEVVRETTKLGTAGALGLIGDRINAPLIVSNADLLTTIDYRRLLEHHQSEQADVTCAIRPIQMAVPYGVVDVEAGLIAQIREKPTYSYMVNAGINCIGPEVCRFVRPGEAIDMPDLLNRSLARERRVVPFLLHEYWVDIGNPEDYYRANSEFSMYFRDQSSGQSA